MFSRRIFLKVLLFFKLSILANSISALKIFAKSSSNKVDFSQSNTNSNPINPIGTDNGKSYVYKISNGTPEENMNSLVELLGGIGNIIDKNDIVVLKPNAQWWMQGMTNTDAMKEFISIILNSNSFTGEIIIAENHQFLDYNGRGWSTDQPNGTFNYNQLIRYFNEKSFMNVSSYKWRCAGPNPTPLEGDDDGSGAKVVTGPADGDGYVWRNDIVYISPENKKCWMTYPVFTSKYSGITIDLKNGAWKNGRYLNNVKVKLINFSALNHHGFYSGVTASIKNLMGVVDMSCGYQAPTPNDTYNVHFIGVKKFIKHQKKFKKKYLKKIRQLIWRKAYKNFYFTGGALGKFMKDIRTPDLNIITAHWVGWGSRWDSKKSSYPKALLASRDPVALDYVAAKDILLPETPVQESEIRKLNNPDIKNGPFFKFLQECNRQGIGHLSESKIHRVEMNKK